MGPRTDPEKAQAALVAAQMSNTVEDTLSQMILFEYKEVAKNILKVQKRSIFITFSLLRCTVSFAVMGGDMISSVV